MLSSSGVGNGVRGRGILRRRGGRGIGRAGLGGRGGGLEALLPLCLSHPIFRRKSSAYLYACQDQVSCI
jgi:hypothetical protein